MREKLIYEVWDDDTDICLAAFRNMGDAQHYRIEHLLMSLRLEIFEPILED